MKENIDINKRLHNAIYAYLKENVWNLPLLECRRNIIPLCLNHGHTVIARVDLGCQSVDLPPNKSFYVYAVSNCCMGGLVIDTELETVKSLLSDQYIENWLPLDKYLNVRPFDLRLCGINGEWLHRSHVYIRNHPYQDMFLLAVETSMARQILNESYDFKNIILSVYYDSDNDINNLLYTSKKISSFYTSSINVINQVYTYYHNRSTTNLPGMYASERDQTICFIDGRESVPESLSDIKFNQYVEIVEDPDIIYNIVLDLTKIGQNNVYRSTIDNTYRYIVHIPKIVNKNNYLISHNTCDIFVRPINSQNASQDRLSGLFLHRANTSLKEDNNLLVDHMITQITHNDFGISEKLILSRLENPLKISECVIRIVVRRHSKSKRLKYDSNYINLLYNGSTDSEILKFLSGYGDPTLPFWRAENLEQSNFSKMIVNLQAISNTSKPEYNLNALGYFNSLDLLSDRIIKKTIESNNERTFIVNIPICMQYCSKIGVIAYLSESVNDKHILTKINSSKYSCEMNMNNLIITFLDTVNTKVNDQVIFELFDNDTFYGEYFTPSSENNTFWLQEHQQFDIYRVVEESATSNYYTDNYQIFNNESYIKLDNISEVAEKTTEQKMIQVVLAGTMDITKVGYRFNTIEYGNKFFICSKTLFQRFNETDIEAFDGNTKFASIQNSANNTYTDLLHSGNLMLSATSFRWNFKQTTDTEFQNDKLYYKKSFIYKPTNSSPNEQIPESQEFYELQNSNYIRTNDETFQENKTYYIRKGIRYILENSGYDSNNTYYEEIKEEISVPIINRDWNAVVFVNGKELVQDIDYSFKPITSASGIKQSVIFFNINDDRYIKRIGENNKFEIFITSDKEFSKFNGFIDKNYIKDHSPYVYWFDNISSITVNGKYRTDLNPINGYLTLALSYPQPGAIYYIRGFVPIEVKEYLDQYIDINTDLSKLSAIAEYYRKKNPIQDTSITVIPQSHHITSITMNAIVKDVLSGTKTLLYESDPRMMLRQLTEYESMKQFDATLSGVSKDLYVTNAGLARANGTYKLKDTSAIGIQREWELKIANTIILCEITENAYRWKLATVSNLGTLQTYYYADDPTGIIDPWNLVWHLAQNNDESFVDENQSIPTFKSGNIDLRYIDLFPSYSSDLHFVDHDVVLKQAMRALFPTDNIKDGDTVS